MRVLKLILCLGVAVVDCDPSHDSDSRTTPTLSLMWNSKFSMGLRLPDGRQDEISLRHSDTAGGVAVPCLFEGTLHKDATGNVAVLGCRDSNKTQVTIVSKYSNSTMFNILKNNKTEEIPNPYATTVMEEKEIMELNEEANLQDRVKRSTYPILPPDYDEYELSYSNAVLDPVPNALIYGVELAYDDSFLIKMKNNKVAAEQYILTVMRHTQVYLLHDTLGSRIHFHIRNKPRHLQGESLKINDVQNGISPSMEKAKRIPSQFALIIFIHSDNSDAFMGVACRRYGCDPDKARAIVKERSSVQKAAMTCAHEIVHLLGPYHDKQEEKKLGLNGCIGEGLMSDSVDIGLQKEQWSTCTKSRFQRWFNSYGKFCTGDRLIEGVVCSDDSNSWTPPCLCGRSLCTEKHTRCDFATGTCLEKLWRDDGRCGEDYPLPNGKPGQCDSTANANEKGPCCSSIGWCGNSDDHCKCSSCVSYAEPIITKFHISSTIQFRYARTVVESRMKNPGSVAQKVSFSAIIPKSAFISSFVITIDDTPIVATVQEKKEAKEIFDGAVSEGRSAALVTQDFRDSNLFTINANIEAGGEIDFRLRYEELLERKLGWYKHIININPGQIVDDLKINVNIDESSPLAKLRVPELKESNVFEKGQDNKIATVDWEKGSATARIEFAPTREQQMEYEEQKLAGHLLIKYDLERDGKDNEVQVIDGYFVHYFTPENLPPLPKHIIFVLDISGSMVGGKIVQLKDAMFTILNDMTERDYFNIITFSSNSSHWRQKNENRNVYDPIQATNENRKDAIIYTNRLPADGNTNINDGLLEGLRVAESARINKRLPTNLQSIMVFLSNGAPTEGVTEGHEIRQNVKDANLNLSIPIYSLGFGRDADFNLIRQISDEANAFSKHIYEGSDAAFQLEDFFSQISSPLLSNLTFKYQGRVNQNNSLIGSKKRIIEKYSVSYSQPKLSTFFKGGELVVAGQLLNPEQKNILKAVVKGNGENGTPYKKTIFACLYPCAAKGENITDEKPEVCYAKCQSQPSHRRNAQKFLRKLHSFLNVNNLLKSKYKKIKDKKKVQDKKKAKALEIARNNNFVTEITSLVVVRSNVTTNTSSLDYLLSKIKPAIEDYDEYAGEPEIVYDGGCPNPCPENCTGSITMFSKTYFRGENITLSEDTPDLAKEDFDDKLVSLRVEGNCCWNVYPEAGYGGRQISFENDEWNMGIYKSTTSVRTMFREASSVKLKVGC